MQNCLFGKKRKGKRYNYMRKTESICDHIAGNQNEIRNYMLIPKCC